MAPMCTPEKHKAETLNNVEELYFNPMDIESITDCSDIDEDDDEDFMNNRMDKLLTDLPDLDRLFNLHGQVGEGTFSTVYVASLKNDATANGCYAIKHIVPTCHPERIKFELKCLKDIGGLNNVAGVDLCLRNGNNVIFVMPYQAHDSFSEYVGKMEAKEAALYMKSLLTAIAHVHTFNVIHRDIKPSNFLYDRHNKKFLLVDFGLAQLQPTELCKNETNQNSQKSNKRKRDPDSPVDGIKQRTKRQILQNRQLNILNIPKIAIAARKLIISPTNTTQKENNTIKLLSEKSPKGDNTPKRSSDINKDTNRITDGCGCYGKAKACSTCIVKKNIQASRAGTPGFRPPEVLLKYPHQTIAIDVWSAGIIMLSILSNSTNFFSCPNDLSALAELITLFGYDALKRVASDFGRYLVCSENKPKLDLRKICCSLRIRGKQMDAYLIGDKCANCEQFRKVCLCPNVPLDKDIEDLFPETAYNLLQKLLNLNPKERITAEDALKHPFFNIL